MQRRSYLLISLVGITTLAAVAAYASTKKKPGEPCAKDDECKGHCYTRKTDNKEVCVDCNSSTISTYRGRISSYCKIKRSCLGLNATTEVAKDLLEDRIAKGDDCLRARNDEAKDCWDGGDSGHKEAIRLVVEARATCVKELSDRKSNGFLYTCSDSTYSSKSGYVARYCSAYGKGCSDWKKNDDIVDCGDIEDAMEKVDECVEAVEALDSDCLPRLSSIREKQWTTAQTSLDNCKEVLKHKKDKSLCK